MASPYRSAWDIPNNDLAACIAYYEEHGVDEDEIRTMFKLQDDPTELRRVAKNWVVRPNAVVGRSFVVPLFPFKPFTPGEDIS